MACRILLADDHTLFRQGVRALLEREGLSVVAEASDGSEAVRLARDLRPDAAVLDVSMPVRNGIEAARELRTLRPPVPALLLTVHFETPYVAEAFRAGAAGYVLKTQASSDLAQAIRAVVRGERYVSPGVSDAVVDAIRDGAAAARPVLTGRERQLLQLVAEGRSTRAIAALLGVSPKTAESHRARVMKKLGIHETAGLVRYAVREGLVEP